MKIRFVAGNGMYGFYWQMLINNVAVLCYCELCSMDNEKTEIIYNQIEAMKQYLMEKTQ